MSDYDKWKLDAPDVPIVTRSCGNCTGHWYECDRLSGYGVCDVDLTYHASDFGQDCPDWSE